MSAWFSSFPQKVKILFIRTAKIAIRTNRGFDQETIDFSTFFVLFAGMMAHFAF
jgi:hypothetical protein